jgi:hypothetical protein
MGHGEVKEHGGIKVGDVYYVRRMSCCHVMVTCIRPDVRPRAAAGDLLVEWRAVEWDRKRCKWRLKARVGPLRGEMEGGWGLPIFAREAKRIGAWPDVAVDR